MAESVPVRVDRGQYEALQAIRTDVGVPVVEQVRRAVAAWLAAHDHPAARRRQVD